MKTTSYDPNSETTDEEKAVAAHWECLRRNKAFRSVSECWIKSEEFRRAHSMTPHYHDMQYHTPRCAWDWMLTAEQRGTLAQFQLEQLLWFLDGEYNFGPIVSHEYFSPASFKKDNWPGCIKVEPMPNPPKPITIDDAWNRTPDVFKQQFRLARCSKHEFCKINSRIAEHVRPLRLAAKKLAAGDPRNEAMTIADYLFSLGSELHELSEFCALFKIPKSRYSEKQFEILLGKIRTDFKTAGLLVPTKTYDRHKSYQGTEADWRWFLESERLGLDMRKAVDCYELTKLYSKDVRYRAMRGKAPPRAKPYGHTDSKIPSKAIKNRRSTIKQHVHAIEKWILDAYPLSKE